MSVTKELRVGLTDVNDNAPLFGQEVYSVTVAESAVVDTSIATLTATDLDSVAFNYSIIDGNTGGFFQFDGSTVDLLTVAAVIDLDSLTNNAASYVLTVKVADGGIPEQTGTAMVYVSVTPTNDNPPTLASVTPIGTVSVSETVKGGVIERVRETDR